MEIICITGTKGKTTVTRAIDHALCELGEKTLRVDTDGYYLCGKQKGSLDDSKKIFGLVPTVCPGKFLLTAKKYLPNCTAVLETALGSNGKAGLGYNLHQIGIFTNVLEDHLGVTKKLKNRIDLAKAKSFVFSNIDDDGYAVFNADDRYVCSRLKNLPTLRKVTLLPFGVNFHHFNLQKHLAAGGKCLTLENDFFVVKSSNLTTKILPVKDIYWTFNGFFKPSIYNLLAVFGGIYAHYHCQIPTKATEALKNYKLDPFGGRLTLFKNKQGVKILLDYAHEKYSLLEVARLAKKLSGRKTIGVVRLAPDRTDKMIFETGKAIANKFDNLIVYDKIDGINRKSYKGKKINLTRGIGEVSEIFLSGILSAKKNKHGQKIIIEDAAIKKAAETALTGDVVVVICGDNKLKTIASIREHFQAKPQNI